MTSERWEQITEIYTAALELKSEERSVFLDEICAGDADLRREVESLLKADAEAGDFISEPVIKDIAPLITIENEHSFTAQNLAHYQILSRLGKGGMGEVYLARDSRLHRQVALKILPASLSEHENYLQRFQTEAKAVAALNHPNIATIYSVEEAENKPFITMEFVEGKTLDKVLAGKNLDLKNFLEWFVPLADALSHAHEKDVIHRDIKPSNIMISENGVPKILDFGLAKLGRMRNAERGTRIEEAETLINETTNNPQSAIRIPYLTMPGKVMGTPSYMSPEQAEGKAVDHRSDIFSFGVVMYEAITGNRPFKGETQAAVIGELMSKQPPSISETNPEMPFLLSRLVERCLHKERHKRFQTMNEVRVILEEIQAAIEAGVSLHSSSIPALSKSKLWSQKWIFAPALLLIAAVVFGIYYFRPASVPPVSFENLTLRKLSQTNNVVYAHISPDGKSVAYNTIDENETRSLWVRQIEDKNALQLLPQQSVYFWGGLTFSLDGNQIYYITANRDAKHGTLYRISSLGGAPRKLVETVNDLGGISPDFDKILLVRYGEQMQILTANASDGTDEQVIFTGEANHIFRDPQFSADGKKIYFIKLENLDGEEFWSLREISAEGKNEKIIVQPRKTRISEIVSLKDGKGLLINAIDAVSNLPQLFHVNLSDGKEMRLTNDLNAYFGISASDDGKIIISAQRNSAKDIWIAADENKNNLRKITTESNVYTSAVFTPDGKIVYDATDNNRPHIWKMNADGSNPQQLTPNNSFDYEPRVSPDGRFIVFTSNRTGERKIWRMNADGSNPVILTDVKGAAFGPMISPDGQNVMFHWNKENRRILGKVPITGGEISEQPRPNEGIFAYSPDGKQIAQVIYDETEKKRKIEIRSTEPQETLKTFDFVPTGFLLWTADGKHLLYRNLELTGESSSTAWIQAVSGGEPKQFLTVKPDWLFYLSLSKDEKQTAVVRGKLLTDAVMLNKIR